MEITWNDLTIDFTHIDLNRLIENWDWLIGNDKKPILVSSIGDLFLENNDGIYWLNVGEGIIEKVAKNQGEFKNKLNDNEIVNEWFLINLVKELKSSGLILTEKKLYGYKTLPILGGEYKPDNFKLIDIEIHFELNGQIHKQIKDLPDGTNVKIEVK